MKIYPFLVLAVLSACSSNITGIADNKLVLSEGETYKTDDFSLSLFRIDDSRCPKDVECVWAGQAVTHLEVLTTEPDTVSLCIGTCGQPGESDTSIFQAGDARYRLLLKAVNPYPVSGNEKPEKSAVFELVSLK